MFSQATDMIRRMEYNLKNLESRTCQIECDVYHIRKDNGLDGMNIEDKMATVKYDIMSTVGSNINTLSDRLSVLEGQVSELQSSVQELLSAICADSNVKTVSPKQKIDLEILEENDPFITPQYYLDDDKKKDYWYWNGEE